MSFDQPRRSILVIDDEPPMASLMRSILEAAGFEVTCILDGVMALKRIAGEGYDVILTDMFMPEVDGAQLICEARRLGSRARLVAVSGGGAFSTPEEALKIADKIGADAVVQKPFTAAELVAACSGTSEG